MVLLNAKSINYTLYQQWGARGSAEALECELMSQSNESDGNANFIRAVIYLYGFGGKKSAYFLSLSGENAHPVVLRP